MTRGGTRSRWPTRSPTPSPNCGPRCCPACWPTWPATSVAGSRDLAVFEMGLVFLPAASAERAPRPAVTARPSEAELAAIMATRARSAAAPGRCVGRREGAAGLVGPRSHRELGRCDRVGSSRGRAAARVELEIVKAEVAPVASGPVCRTQRCDGKVVGTAGELHPRVRGRARPAAADQRDGTGPGRDRRARAGAGPGVVQLPAGAARPGPGGQRRRPGRARAGGGAGRSGRAAGVGSAVRRLRR